MSYRIEILGSLLRAFLDAGKSLHLLMRDPGQRTRSFVHDKWYPIEEFERLLQRTYQYKNYGNILEQIGIEMMKGWYERGPGGRFIASSVDFLNFQTSSKGFRSVVKGPPELTGNFDLVDLDLAGGTAGIHSSTVFPREIELGILLGGLGLTGDLLFYTVTNTSNPDHFTIYFVTRENRTTLSWRCGKILEENEWKIKQLEYLMADKEQYWQSINETLNTAFHDMQEALSKVKQLSGMLPICASCKKIRDDRGYWKQIEIYISDHSEADFTHGICPECAKKLYPGLNLQPR